MFGTLENVAQKTR